MTTTAKEKRRRGREQALQAPHLLDVDVAGESPPESFGQPLQAHQIGDGCQR
jgi:hypothetical protein